MNRQTLNQLIENSKSDLELLGAIQDALKSFEEYHTAIYSMETRKKLLIGTVDAQKYQEEVTAMDQKRTNCHNAVLANVSMLNRRNTGLKVKNMQCYFSNQKSPWLIATDARVPSFL